MAVMNLDELKYPIGKFESPAEIGSEHINKWVQSIETLPESLRKTTEGLTEDQWQMEYRPGSWNVRQIVHHLADSHINSYCRFKAAITEDNPTIKPYDENLWAKLPDALDGDPRFSIDLLKGLHYRWSALLKTLDAEQLKRTFYHPEHEKSFPLDVNLGFYAWHSDHHLAQIEQALHLKGNFA